MRSLGALAGMVSAFALLGERWVLASIMLAFAVVLQSGWSFVARWEETSMKQAHQDAEELRRLMHARTGDEAPACARAKSGTSPCVLRDGATSVALANEYKDPAVCVGCDTAITTLLDAERLRVPSHD